MGLSQTAFAALASASRGAQLKWEKDEAAPNANGLLAWTEAGADVLYILTGRRSADRPDNPASQIVEQVAQIRRDMLAQVDAAGPWENASELQQQRLQGKANQLDAILRFDAKFLTPEMREEVESLRAIIGDPQQLAAFRAADHVQHRARRREVKAEIIDWAGGDEAAYRPGEGVANLLATMALDYGVPIRLLAELVDEFGEEAGAKDKLAASLAPDR